MSATKPGINVRAATVDDLPAISSLLADAFLADPVMTWAFPHDQRHHRLATLFGYLAEHLYVPQGLSTIAEDADGVPVGTALWRTPNAEVEEAFWETHGAAFVGLLEGDMELIGQVSALMAEHHPDDDHRYLLAIGTDPNRQSQGIGSALGAHTIEQLRAEGTHGYLEATSPRSKALYLRWGFEVISEFAAEGAPPIWGMWLEAT